MLKINDSFDKIKKSTEFLILNNNSISISYHI